MNYTKIKSKCSIDLKVKLKKLLEKNIWQNLGDLGQGKGFLATKLKAQFTKKKSGKLDLNFCFIKTLLREWKYKPHTGRKYLQVTFLSRTSSNKV